MAKVIFNSVIRSARGSFDGAVFYERHGKFCMRSKGTVRKKQSTAQKAVRDAFREAAACWKKLSREQKEPWRAYAREMNMTGYNAFQKMNVPRCKQGMPVTTTVPVMSAPVGSTHARTPYAHTTVDAGCIAFMASIHEMMERVSGECVRAGVNKPIGSPAILGSPASQ